MFYGNEITTRILAYTGHKARNWQTVLKFIPFNSFQTQNKHQLGFLVNIYQTSYFFLFHSPFLCFEALNCP